MDYTQQPCGDAAGLAAHVAAANPHSGSMPLPANTIVVQDGDDLQAKIDMLGTPGENLLVSLRLDQAMLAEHDTLTITCNGVVSASTTYEFIDILGSEVVTDGNVKVDYVSTVAGTDITAAIDATQGPAGTGALLVSGIITSKDNESIMVIAVNPSGGYDSISVSWSSEGISERTHIVKRTDDTQITCEIKGGNYDVCLGVPDHVDIVGYNGATITDDDTLDAAVYLGTNSTLTDICIDAGYIGVYLNPLHGVSAAQYFKRCNISAKQWCAYASANLYGAAITHFSASDSVLDSMNPIWIQVPYRYIDVYNCVGSKTESGTRCCAFFDGKIAPNDDTHHIRINGNYFRGRRTSDGSNYGTESYCIRITGHSYDISGNTILIDNDAAAGDDTSPIVVVNGSKSPLPDDAQAGVISGNTFQVKHNHGTKPSSVTAIKMHATGTDLLADMLVGQNTWNSNIATKFDIDPAQDAASPKPTVQVVSGAFAGFTGATRKTNANVTVEEI